MFHPPLATRHSPLRVAMLSVHTCPLAMLGGKPVRSGGFPSWPMIEKNDEAAWADVLQKKGWCRLDGDYVNQFEKEYAKLTGVKECLATSNGTNALFGSMSALDIGPGDEVLVSPYTFVATINVPFLKYAPDLMVQKFDVRDDLAGVIPSILPFATIPLTVIFGGFYDRKGKGATIMALGSLLLVVVHLIFTIPMPTHWVIAVVPTLVLGFGFYLVPSAM